MTGSNAAAIVTPIVAFILLAVWLGIVFYADSHPRYPSKPPAPVREKEIAGEERQDDRVPPMPRPRASLDEPSEAGTTSGRRPEG